jgi:hypothetical protein
MVILEFSISRMVPVTCENMVAFYEKAVELQSHVQ